MVGFVSFYPGATTGRDYQPTQESNYSLLANAAQEPTLFDTKPRLSAKGEAVEAIGLHQACASSSRHSASLADVAAARQARHTGLCA
ncbi:hypothetical protein HaLaN_02775, partial [Haematococcus lacustris]